MRMVWSVVLALALGGCPKKECAPEDNRCDGNVAVNCLKHCGFGPCSQKPSRQECSPSQTCVMRAAGSGVAESDATQIAECVDKTP